MSRFALGLALGLGPLFLEILAEASIPPSAVSWTHPRPTSLGSLILFPPLLSIPLVTAHAVVADRLLDVRPLLGRAARYLLARTTLSLMMAMPLVALAAVPVRAARPSHWRTWSRVPKGCCC